MLRNLLQEHAVSTTALLANYWKSEARCEKNWDRLCQKKGARAKDLFKDKLNVMEKFIDEEVVREGKDRLDKNMWLPLATRTRFFRKTVSKHVKNGQAEQVIILGCGFDTLSMSKKKYSAEFKTKFFEIDQPNVLACKKAILEKCEMDTNATYIPLDYVKGDLCEALRQAGVDFTKPTLILWEGNTFYLERDDVIATLKKLSSSFDKLVLSFDYMHGTMQTKTNELDTNANSQALENTLTAFEKKKSPFKSFFDPTDMNAICEALGLTLVDRQSTADLAILYDVDRDPYYTAKPYSVTTFKK